MDIQVKDSVSPPFDDTEYTIKIVDYGQGNHQLSVTPETTDSNTYDFAIINLKLQECQWRSEKTVPTRIIRAVEHYGYHVTDATSRPTHGLYENVQYFKTTIDTIDEELHPENTLGHAATAWVSESLDTLAKLELLRAHLTQSEYDIVLFKAQETSYDHPSGNLTLPTTQGPTSASLKSMVTLMIAYAQHDGYLSRDILDSSIVEKLVRGGRYA